MTKNETVCERVKTVVMIVVFTVSLTSFLYSNLVVVPRFELIFNSVGGQLPPLTTFCLFFSYLVQDYLVLWGVIFASALFFLIRIWRKDGSREYCIMAIWMFSLFLIISVCLVPAGLLDPIREMHRVMEGVR